MGRSISGPSISGPLAYGGVVWVLVAYVRCYGVSFFGPSISGPLAYGGVVWVLVVACVHCYYAMPINTYVSINKKPFRVIPCSILVKTDFSDRQLIIAV